MKKDVIDRMIEKFIKMNKLLLDKMNDNRFQQRLDKLEYFQNNSNDMDEEEYDKKLNEIIKEHISLDLNWHDSLSEFIAYFIDGLNVEFITQICNTINPNRRMYTSECFENMIEDYKIYQPSLNFIYNPIPDTISYKCDYRMIGDNLVCVDLVPDIQYIPNNLSIEERIKQIKNNPKIITSALSDTIPINWSKDVIEGKKLAIIDKTERR